MTGTISNISNIVDIPMPFCGPMPYTMQFSAHQISGQVELCLKRGYALSEVCLMRGLTVVMLWPGYPGLGLAFKSLGLIFLEAEPWAEI